MKHTLLILGLILSFSTCFAGTYRFVLSGVPKIDASCHITAKNLEGDFKKITGISDATVACTKEVVGTNDFEVSYTASGPLQKVTTDLVTPYGQGRFKELSTCQLVLPREAETFEAQTGLKKFISFCRREGESLPSPWYPVILGFGTPRKSPYVSGYAYFSAPKKFDSKIFVESLRQALIKKDAYLVDVKSNASLGYGKMAIYYYAKEKQSFELFELGQTETEKACDSDLNFFLSLVNTDLLTPVYSYCGKVQILGLWELTSLYIAPTPIRLRSSAERFHSFKECEFSRGALVDYYQKKVDPKILGGFCKRENETISVQLLLPSSH